MIHQDRPDLYIPASRPDYYEALGLADRYLEAIDQAEKLNALDMCAFLRVGEDRFDDAALDLPPACGTTACVAGWMAIQQHMQDTGMAFAQLNAQSLFRCEENGGVFADDMTGLLIQGCGYEDRDAATAEIWEYFFGGDNGAGQDAVNRMRERGTWLKQQLLDNPPV